MGKRKGMEIALAAAEAAALCRPDVIAAYPITPNTHIPEHLSDIVAEGRLDAEFICVESEHSALSACMGASGAGARVFTATSSQGLLYMAEIMAIASSMRLPVVMALGNRALSGPLNIWNDHSDIMSQRDTGWISLFASHGQEVIDMVIQSFRIAEDRDVMLPININLDGFQLTHVVEVMDFPLQEEVDAFLPVYKPYASLHPDHPCSMGTLGLPEIFAEATRAREAAVVNSRKTILKVWDEWEKRFGRRYEPIESYKMKGAEVAVLTMGSMGETAEVAIDALREKGVPVGLLKLKLWRPFPYEDLQKAVKGVKSLIVMDRAVSFGGPGGPVASEIRSALYDDPNRPDLTNYIFGLGGRDVTVEDFITMIDKVRLADKKRPKEHYEFYGVRGE
ncbi:MAG TPA: transketolase C-terminal domain-containing protein [Syntrophales bacterium]|jgi:pyruvate ferredoxin oxidoreductase alpha subunit|nr:transketolase C-terminal domain-containing protein [Syntrophales bacterium]HPX56578.1 transketolase C-terminal domain-containing protein [Syntrophales bacterium]HQA83278.1 transketolase C-terminal domain-containing protein [Syntrophales bacterium]